MKTVNRITLFLLFPFITFEIFSQVQPIKVDFFSDGYKLNAEIYHMPTEKPMPTLILMHGYPGGEGDPLGLAKRLSPSGINVLCLIIRGPGAAKEYLVLNRR